MAVLEMGFAFIDRKQSFLFDERRELTLKLHFYHSVFFHPESCTDGAYWCSREYAMD